MTPAVLYTPWLVNPGAQEAAWSAFQSRAYRYLLLEGGFRSGKTWTGSRMLAEALTINECCDGLAVGTTYKLVREVMVPELMRACREKGLRPKFHSSHMVIQLRALENSQNEDTWNGNVIILCRSAERGESIEGFEVGCVWADERGRWPRKNLMQDASKQVKARMSDMRAVYPIQIDTGTPEGTATSTFEEYHRKPTKWHWSVTMPTTENTDNLHPDYIAGLEASFDAEVLRQYRDGIPTDVGVGFAYQGYGEHNHGEVRYDPRLPLWLMFDFGTKMGCVIVGQPQGELPDAPLHILAEVIDQGGASTHKLIEGLREIPWVVSHQSAVNVFGDSSGDRADTRGNEDDWQIVGLAMSEMWEPGQWYEYVPSANPRRRQRVLRMRALFRDGAGRVRFKLDPDKTPTLHKDFGAVQWKGDDLDHGPDGLLTHASDAVGYAVHVAYPLIEVPEFDGGGEGEMLSRAPGGAIDARAGVAGRLGIDPLRVQAR